jgi:GTP-binding protein
LPEDLAEKTAALQTVTASPVFAISASAHRGLEPLLDAAIRLVRTDRARREAEEAETATPVITLANYAGRASSWHVEPAGEGVWRITGERIEGFARRTNFDSDDAVIRLRDILRKTGVARELRRQGAQPEDLLRIAAAEFPWQE